MMPRKPEPAPLCCACRVNLADDEGPPPLCERCREKARGNAAVREAIEARAATKEASR